MGFRLLHIYTSEACHEEAWIVGDVEALKALRNCIDQAIQGQELDGEHVQGAAVEAFTQDGEGFACIVRVVDSTTELALPYAEPAVVNRSGTHPVQLGHYRALYNSRTKA